MSGQRQPSTSPCPRATPGFCTPSGRRLRSTSAPSTSSKAVRECLVGAAPPASRKRSGSASTWSRATASASFARPMNLAHPVWVDDPTLRPRRSRAPRGASAAGRWRRAAQAGDANPVAASRHAAAAVGGHHRHRPAQRSGRHREPRASRDGRWSLVGRHHHAAARHDPRRSTSPTRRRRNGHRARRRRDWQLIRPVLWNVGPQRKDERSLRAGGLEHHARSLEERLHAERQDGHAATRPLLQPKDRHAAKRPRPESAPVRLQGAQGTVRLHRERRGAGRGF